MCISALLFFIFMYCQVVIKLYFSDTLEGFHIYYSSDTILLYTCKLKF